MVYFDGEYYVETIFSRRTAIWHDRIRNESAMNDI